MLINELGRIYLPRNRVLSMPRDCPLLAQPRPLTSVQQVAPPCFPCTPRMGWGVPPPGLGCLWTTPAPQAGKRQDAGAGLCVRREPGSAL